MASASPITVMPIKVVLSLLVLATAAMAHPDPSAKPVSRLTLPQRFGDCQECSITASPAVIKGAAGWVTLDIDGVHYGRSSDWVGVIEAGDLSQEGSLLRYPMRYQSAARSCWPRSIAPPAMHNLTCAGEACCAPNTTRTRAVQLCASS